MSQNLKNYIPPPHPKGISLEGKSVIIAPLDAYIHAEDLFASFQMDETHQNWRYLPYGPFASDKEFVKWLDEQTQKQDPVFFAIISKAYQKAVGIASYLRISPMDGSIEVGHIHYSPLLQQTKAGTEAMYLMMQWAFENGYRRYEWKCNARNIRSRQAAQRLGFSYEGVFRQATISKGENRDTAWFAMIDQEWAAFQYVYEDYLRDENFTEENKPIISLSSLTSPLLYKKDDMSLSE